MLEGAARGSRMRQREQLNRKKEQGIEEDVETEESSIIVTPLTVSHMQGPLILLMMGLLLGGTSFLAEKINDQRSFHSRVNK